MANSGTINLLAGATIPTPASGQIAIGSKTGSDISTVTAAAVSATLLNGTAVDTIDHLLIGTGSVPATGGLAYSGDLAPIRGGVGYTGYLYVPLAAALTCASFSSAVIAAGTYTVGGSGDGGVSYNYAYPRTAKALHVRCSGRWAAASNSSVLCAYCVGSTSSDAAPVSRAQVAAITSDGAGDVTLDANGRFIIYCSLTTATGSTVIVLGYFI